MHLVVHGFRRADSADQLDVFEPVQVRLDLSHPETQTIAVSIQWTPQSQRQTFQLPVDTGVVHGAYAQHLHSLQLARGASGASDGAAPVAL